MSIAVTAISSTMKRVRFDSVFRIMPNGTIRPLTNVQIADVTFGPGTAFSQAVAFGGVRLAKYAGHDLQVEEKDDRLILKGVYK